MASVDAAGHGGGRPGVAIPRVHWAVLGVLLGLAGLALVGPLNQSLFEVVNGWGMVSPGAWASITVLGDSLVVFSLMLPVVLVRPDIAWAVVPTALLATVLTHVPKNLVEAARPLAELGPEQVTVIGHSLRQSAYPSGHSATVFATAAVLAVTLGLRGRRLALLLGLGALVAVSRVVVGAHWPRDIAMGAAVGWFSGLAGAWLAARAPWGTGRVARWILGAIFLACTLYLPFHASGYPDARPLQWTVAVIALGCFSLHARRAVRSTG